MKDYIDNNRPPAGGGTIQILYLSPDELKPYPKNAKTHPQLQIDQIANSIREFGFRQPIVVDADNVVVIGHGRLMAAKKLGMDKVPVVRADDLTEEQVIEKLLELIRSCPDCSPYVTYSEALKIVCEALAEGYFASLYKIVERDADLVFVDEDKCISGERDIFNFLVQEIKEHRYEILN